MLSLILPGRSARECRNKFNNEDRKNPDRVNWALKNPRPMSKLLCFGTSFPDKCADLALLTEMTGKSFHGPLIPLSLPNVDTDHSQDSNECKGLNDDIRAQEGDNFLPQGTQRVPTSQLELSRPHEVEYLGGIDDGYWD